MPAPSSLYISNISPTWLLNGRSSGNFISFQVAYNVSNALSGGYGTGPNGEQYALLITSNLGSFSRTDTVWSFTSTIQGTLYVNNWNINLGSGFTNNQTLGLYAQTYYATTSTTNITVKSIELNYNGYATTSYIKYNQSTTLPSSSTPTGYYTPTQWTANGTTFSVGGTFTPSNYSSWFSSTWKVSWTPVLNKITYTIGLDANGGTGGSISTNTYQIEATIQSKTITLPTRDGWSLNNWTLSNTAGNTNTTGNVYFTNSDTTLNIKENTYGAFTIVANWNFDNDGVTYNITKSQATGTSITVDSTYDASTSSQLKEATITASAGYNLTGVSLSRVASHGVSYGGDSPTISLSTGDTYSILIPAYSFGNFRVNSTSSLIDYTISYVLNNGTGAHGNPTSYNVESTISLVQGSMVRTGYTFGGWFDNAQFSGSAITSFTGQTGNKTFYAKWIIISYDITYTLSGSTAYPITNSDHGNPTTYDIEDAIITFVQGNLARAGWTFNVWNPTSIAAGSTGNKSTTASWNAVEYTISLSNNSGTGIAIDDNIYDTSENDGSAITRTLTEPTRAGWTFNSYSITRTGTNGGGAPSINTDTLSIPSGSYGPMTVTAQWDGNTGNTISFAGATISSQTWTTSNASQDKTFTIPTKTGYKLPTTSITSQSQGYNSSVSNNGYDGTLTIPANAYGSITTTIGYTAISYTVTFDSQGGNAIGDISATYDTALGTLTSPVKDGYTFTEWNTSADGTGNTVISTSTNLTSTDADTVTVYAQWTVNTLTIQYDKGTGTGTMTNSSGVYGNNVLVKANTFTKTGYSFDYWLSDDSNATYTELDQNTSYAVSDLSSLITTGNDTIKLTAQWLINSYTVSFNSNGGSAVSAITQNYGTSVAQPSNPTKTGHTFSGWYYDSGLTSAVTWPFNMPAYNQTLYAKWTINQYTIIFDTNGGSTINSITQDFGTTVTQPSDPTKTENVFAGWYADSSFTTAYTFTTMPASNITVFAKWNINQYTLKYIDYDGTIIQTNDYDYGFDLTTHSAPSDPSRTGYTFSGWDDTVPTTMPAENITITATYTINQYTITIEENGGTTASDITQDYDTAITLPTITKTGYTFDDWYSDSALTTLYSYTTMPAANTTAYAGWTINQYTITVNLNGGTGVSNIVQDYDTAITEPSDPTRTGYTFDDWYEEPNFTTQYVWPTTMPAYNDEIYAKWTINQYTIYFEENGGSLVNDITQNYLSAVNAPTDPTREGYNFAGWYSDSNLTTLYTFTTMPLNGITLYAKWNLGTFTLRFLDWDGTVLQTGDYSFGDDLSGVQNPTDPVRTGYTFTGWSSSIPSTMPGQNVSITAQYTINQYSITFIENEGPAMNDITQNYDTAITAPATPSMIGWTFNGYYSDATFQTPYTIPSTMPAFSSTVYLKWTINQYTITLVTNNGTAISPITQNYDTDVTIPATTRSGWTFSGWFTDVNLTTAYTLTKIPAYNQTLYAKWTGINYTITVDLNGGTGETNKSFTTSESSQQRTFKIGTDMTKTVAHKKHTFAYWEIVDNTSGQTSVLSGAVLTIPENAYGNMTIQARWNVAERFVYIGSNRLEENKIRVDAAGSIIKKVVITDDNINETVIYDKDLELESV